MRYILLAFLLISINAFGQKGIIRGTVIEDANGEPLFGVTVQIKGTTNGAITDFDGKFEIQTTPGKYDLQASFVSFQTVTISGLEVSADETTLIDQISLKEDVELLDEVVVTAEVIKTTEAAMITVKRKSANLIDGISAASFRKIGDSDAASAAKRITGVSIEGGKYVYVRGLGDRYTKTLLNGMEIPGLDPDRNTLQMDIFPTNVLSNIVVAKTFTADLPADFTGGLVNIETQDVPDIKTTTAQVGFGFNPRMHFNSDFLTYNGGKTDWLGFDDGTRKLHISDAQVTDVQNAYILNPSSEKGMTYKRQLDSFNKQLGASQKSNFMNYNLGFSTGNQKEIGLGTLGYNLAFTYRSTSEFYDDALFSRYLIDQNESELVLAEEQIGSYSVSNVLLGGMAGFALKRDNSKYRFNILKLQNGESKTGFFNSETTEAIGTDVNGIQSNLEYSQKSMTNLLLSGEYFLDKWILNWRVSPTISSIDDPDIRFTKYEVLPNDGGFEIGTGNSGLPQRIWRELNETNLSNRLDAKREYEISGRDASIKFGVGATFKKRDFIIRQFDLDVNQNDFDGSFDELMEDENLWPNEDANFHVAQYVGGNVNQFDASTSNYSIYASNEFAPLENLKAIVGLRAEAYSQFYTGQNQSGVVLNNEEVINELNLFPTGNFTYSLSQNQNVRFAYTKTIARYSFKEASFIEYYDPLTGRTFLGSLSPIEDNQGNQIWDGDIRSTLINNFDLRWERFSDRGQIFSISGFYKQFNDPIEVVQISGADNNFQPQNVGDATVYGAELEVRQNLGIVSPALSDFFLSGNTTLSVSEITMTDQEFEARQRSARAGENISRERELQGQAPFIINTGLSYDGVSNGLEVGLYYNVQGPTLTYTGGVNGIPDVYSVPFSSVNLSANKTFGQNEKMRLTLKVNNLLNDKREWEYQSFGAEDRPFEARSLGTTVNVGFRYSFN
ncbi:TonB-dependent receptor [Ekhidna lutea]|nr:TonB-dependent receptor [Ekhidna lutea]